MFELCKVGFVSFLKTQVSFIIMFYVQCLVLFDVIKKIDKHVTVGDLWPVNLTQACPGVTYFSNI